MSRAKYSPNLPNLTSAMIYTRDGQWPVKCEDDQEWCSKTMSDGFDCDGFDDYGYSSYNKDGEYVGNGKGVDRNGFTEEEYSEMTDEEWENYVYA